MRRRDKDREGTDATSVAPSTASALLTPLDIQQKEFQVSRLGGYRMRDVDEFLDQLTDAMTAILAENERLRSGAGPSPIVGSPDLEEVSRQADEIIQRARDEAARIIAEANERATTAGAQVPGSVSAADREAVDAFLARERAFLQGLAGLVQEHADGVKAMAREVRRKGSPAPVPTAASEPKQGSEEPPRPASTPSSAGSEPTRPITAVQPAAQDEPIVVNEPEPANTRREDGDESLRELFWGEEG